MNNHLLVTGCHRSGSTYVGHVIAKASTLTYIEEPFNRDEGIKGIDHWFPYASLSPPNHYSKIVDDFFKLKIEYKYYPKGSMTKRMLKRIIGNTASLRAIYYTRFAKIFSSMLIKDPLASFLSNYMHKNHRVNVLVLVRHPVAFYLSLTRLGWKFDFNNFLSQEDLIDQHLSREARLMRRNTFSEQEKIALLWRSIYKVLTDFCEDNRSSRRWLVKLHENICINPLNEFEDIFSFFRLSFREDIKTYVMKTSNSYNPTYAPKNRIHFLYRNSKQLAYHWKLIVDKKCVNIIRKVTEDIASKYYDKSSWSI